MKKLALAVTVATIVAAPVAQSASSLSGSLRYGVNINDNDDNAFTLQNYGSRIKMSGDTAIGSNTGYGKLELRLGGRRNDSVATRLYAVGVKGAFGDLSIGLQDTAFDEATADRTWWNGANVGLVGDRDEKDGAIRYKKSFGPLSVIAGAAFQGGDDRLEDLDLFDFSVKYSGGPITAAVAVQSKEFYAIDGRAEDETGTATSVTGGYNFGSGEVTLTVGVEDEDFTGQEERVAFLAQVGFGDFYGFYGQSEFDDADETETNVGVGYSYTLSDQSLIWMELFSTDEDIDGVDAVTSFNAAYKLDF